MSVYGNRAAIDAIDTDDCFEQFGLAVALDAGNAHDLALVHREAHVVEQRTRPAHRCVHRDALKFERGDVGNRGGSGRSAGQFGADHHLSQIASRDLARDRRSDGLTLADHRDVISDRKHFVEFVRDKHDGDAGAGEFAKGDEQLVDLLRNQHRSGFIENDDASTAKQHLENLDPLPFANPKLGHKRIRVDLKAVGGR